MSTYTCPHCGEHGLSTQKRHWCPKAPKISEVLRLGPPRSRDPIANEYIARLALRSETPGVTRCRICCERPAALTLCTECADEALWRSIYDQWLAEEATNRSEGDD